MLNPKHAWIYDLLLIVVLMVGTYFRVLGLNWDENQHLHPDERFLTMVESSLQPLGTPADQLGPPPTAATQNWRQAYAGAMPDCSHWGGYFDTFCSPLNPQNRGYSFFVYGDLPIVVVRYIAQWANQTGYDQVNLIGRQVSALGDLLTILLLYIIAARVYDRRVALAAAAFSALAVEQIQQSHFFVVDTFANLFIFLAIYFGVEIVLYRAPPASPDSPPAHAFWRFLRDPLFLFSLGFGAALGLATASKLNAAPLAILLPGAFVLRHLMARGTQAADGGPMPDGDYWTLVTLCLAGGALLAVLMFRVFQPYAFSGLGLNPAWIANMKELIGQSSGDVDVPFALQWARRSHLFSFSNLTVWGLGLPLGILAWTGMALMGWRILKGELRHILLWGWTAIYFVWQSLAFNPTMRYQLPVYPLLCLMAGWLLVYVWDQGLGSGPQWRRSFYRLSAAALAVVVLVLTFAWAYAFTRIYTRPVTRVAATRWIYQNVPAALNLRIQTADGSIYQQPLPFPAGTLIQAGMPYIFPLVANASGTLTEIYLPHVEPLMPSGTLPAGPSPAPNSNAVIAGWLPDPQPSASQTLHVGVLQHPDAAADQFLAASAVTSDFAPAPGDPRGQAYRMLLDRPLHIQQGQTYYVRLDTTGALTLVGSGPINESDWDDGLPLRMDGYDAYGGLYQGGLNLQVYWDDNADKLTRYVNTLSQGDYIFISSNRQWATTTRVPERYPLTSAYYRDLIGCPADKDVIWCYNVAKPGMFQGALGYKLVQVFESFPTLDLPGGLHWEANDQFAEEAFTVYDHPKVLIFQKQPGFDAVQVQSILGAVDLSNVVHLTPKQAGSYKSLMLPAAPLALQQAGGTWSRLFSYDWIQNRYPVLGLLYWYLFLLVLGLLTYPIVRLALPGLGDHGYPLARSLGLIGMGYASWASGSLGVPNTRVTLVVIFGLIIIAGLTLGWMQRDELREEWRTRRRYFLMAEGLFLAFFLFDLLIRIGNPDLWHPAKGGERPMDFSYFNAILKSTVFPPYDPWFAGGYINYYYYGFVLVATPVKLLGIVPTIAYNFILPTLFAMVAMGAFCIGWNLLHGQQPEADVRPSRRDPRWIAGLLAALLMVVLGNLGTIRMVYQGLEKMAAPGGNIDVPDTSIVQRFIWASEGLGKAVLGQTLPFGRGDWYWNPSRVIPPGPGNEITEFPFFTFLYSDLHAHMMVMPIALFVVAWALSIVLARARWRNPAAAGLGFLVGGLAIGALYPTNLSDIYTYLPIGMFALGYALWRYADVTQVRWPLEFPPLVRKLALIAGSLALLVVLSYALYEPYRAAYSQGYSSLDPWNDSRTPIWSYLAHWGLFLFVISIWLAWETRQWMAATPVSSLHKLRGYQFWIEGGLALFVIGLLYLWYRQLEIGWVALPLAAWAGVLILRPGQPDVKRIALFWIGTALLITIVVELVAVHGDIGRMNTIFKFYLQAWLLLAVSCGAALTWLFVEIGQEHPTWRNVVVVGSALLLAGAFSFTLTATLDKVGDRMTDGVPLTLDSISYMQVAQYADFNVTMNLNQDYLAIRWMQDHIQGSPVIVEANCPEYHWCTRFTIYTGLPGVVGWNWHQRQQRTLTPQLVEQRVSEINAFYTTPDVPSALAFLKKYDVKYIVVGQLERAEYAGAGLSKFEDQNGQSWNSIYRDGDTVIYQVRP